MYGHWSDLYSDKAIFTLVSSSEAAADYSTVYMELPWRQAFGSCNWCRMQGPECWCGAKWTLHIPAIAAVSKPTAVTVPYARNPGAVVTSPDSRVRPSWITQDLLSLQISHAILSSSRWRCLGELVRGHQGHSWTQHELSSVSKGTVAHSELLPYSIQYHLFAPWL